MPDPDLSATFRAPFKEQVAAFRLRLLELAPTTRWDDLRGAEHDRAFMVAGAMQADLLADLGGAVDKAMSEGTTLEEFRKDFRGIVTKHGWHGWTGEGTKGGEAWRTKVIYKTNLQSSYAAGRVAQLRKSGFKFWIYRHGGSLDPRPEHVSWDGIVLEADHLFWRTHTPKNGWGCSCYINGARTREGARRVGGQPDKNLPDGWDNIDPKTGVQKGLDKGWDHAPGATVSEAVAALAPKIADYPVEIGADLGARYRSGVSGLLEVWSDLFAAFVDQVIGDRKARGRNMVVGALHPEWAAAAAKRGVVPATAEIAVTDKAILHTFRDKKSDQLSLDWYRQMPRWLADPDVVLLDTTSKPKAPSIILVFDPDTSGSKLIVRLNYRLKRSDPINTVMSGKRITQNELRALQGSTHVLFEK